MNPKVLRQDNEAPLLKRDKIDKTVERDGLNSTAKDLERSQLGRILSGFWI